jgi:hypothetical protein
MNSVIVVTSVLEAERAVAALRTQLIAAYHTDLDISIVQSGIHNITVFHEVKGRKNVASTYRIVIIPISMSLEALSGFSGDTNFYINSVIDKLDEMKATVTNFVRRQRRSIAPKSNEAHFNDALKLLFQKG